MMENEEFVYDDDEEEEDWEREDREREERYEQAESLPVMIKAKEILALAETIASLWDDEKDYSGKMLVYDAKDLVSNIYNAEGDDYYSLRIEHAVFVKLTIFELVDHIAGARYRHPEAKEYLELFEPLIEEFREEFLRWVSFFNIGYDCYDDPWRIPFN
jgi:hypothetical protein